MNSEREQNESGSKDITPADRVRALGAKQGQDKSGHEVFTPADTYGPVPVKHGTCEHCGRPLEPESRILAIEHCPTCDGPFSPRVLMRWRTCALWGAVMALPFGLLFFLDPTGGHPETNTWVVFFVMWLVFTLIVALHKILPELYGD